MQQASECLISDIAYDKYFSHFNRVRTGIDLIEAVEIGLK